MQGFPKCSFASFKAIQQHVFWLKYQSYHICLNMKYNSLFAPYPLSPLLLPPPLADNMENRSIELKRKKRKVDSAQIS